MNSSNVELVLLTALAKSARVFAESIEAEMGRTPDMVRKSRVAFDPRTEQPPKKADPQGTSDERNMAYLTYLGAVRLINDSEKRGATKAEVRKYAMKAGYSNARAVNGFSNGEKSTESRADGRWVVPHGKEWLKELAETVEVDLPNVDEAD